MSSACLAPAVCNDEVMLHDRYGLTLSTRSEAAAEAYRDGVDRLLSAWTGALECFERAIAADEGFALAHIACARVHQVHARVSDARTAAGRARDLVAGASERERRHVDILATAIEGQPRLALERALAHLDDHPRDALVFTLPLGAFGLYAFSGRADHDRARVELCERHAASYGNDWWFLTYRGWSLTEAGEVARGLRYTERALDLRRENGNAAHALSHALFEGGQVDDGMAFIESWLPIYDRKAVLNAHLVWHLALFALDRGDTDRALSLYDERLRPDQSAAPPLNTLTDASSLLWRLQLDHRAEAQSRWPDVAAYGERVFPQAGVHFADVHLAFTAAAVGDREAFARRLTSLEALDSAGRLLPGSVVPALARGFAAYAAGDYAAAADILDPALDEVVRIGGSHAQREICEDTYIVACMKAGRHEAARERIALRLDRRPSDRDRRWLATTDHV